MKVGIVGASGYAGETLVKLLLGHPRVELAAVTSRTHAGKALAQVIPAVRGIDRGITFVASDPAALAAGDIPLFFLALPHGAAAEFARALVGAGKRVIDLSRGLPGRGRRGPRAVLRQARRARAPAAGALRPARALPARLEARGEDRRVPGLLPDEHPDPACPAPAGQGGLPRAHRRQQLQRGERRRPEGRRGLPLRGAHREREGLRARQAPAPLGDRGAARRS